MKKRFSLTGAVALVLFSLAYADAAGHKVINGDELQTMMKDGEQLTIVDVREQELFDKGHIPGAILIPYGSAKGRILKELKPEERIVFVCHGGPMGDKLSKILIKNGYGKVHNLGNGMHGWNGPLSK